MPATIIKDLTLKKETTMSALPRSKESDDSVDIFRKAVTNKMQATLFMKVETHRDDKRSGIRNQNAKIFFRTEV